MLFLRRRISPFPKRRLVEFEVGSGEGDVTGGMGSVWERLIRYNAEIMCG